MIISLFLKKIDFIRIYQTSSREKQRGEGEIFGDCRHQVQQIQKTLKE
jgi:hypothetical protein